jgi:hypothetical protein
MNHLILSIENAMSCIDACGGGPSNRAFFNCSQGRTCLAREGSASTNAPDQPVSSACRCTEDDLRLRARALAQAAIAAAGAWIGLAVLIFISHRG